jgi:hypothetical protein
MATKKTIQCPASPTKAHVTLLDKQGNGVCKYCGSNRSGDNCSGLENKFSFPKREK